MSTTDDAQALLARLTDDGGPAGTWSAPGRANLIGEHTDYNDGFALPFAIDRRTVAAVHVRDDARIRVASTFADGDPVEIAIADLDELFATDPAARDLPAWAGYPLGVAWALQRSAAVTPVGVDIALASDVPVGSGLSSSAAIEGAVASALNDVWRAGLSPVRLAQVGRLAENEAVGAPTGIMDQMASFLGEEDAAILLDCRTLDARPTPLGFAAAGLQVVVIDTRVEHAHSTGGYADRRAACERGATALGVEALRDVGVADLPRAAELLDEVTFRRVRHVVTENQRVLDTVAVLAEHGPRAIGDLLTASHVSLRDDFEVSCPELDVAVEAALAAGAIGARMTGGGFGGCAIALVEASGAAAVEDAAIRAFAASGFTPPRVFAVHPSAGAHPDRSSLIDSVEP
ncbi:galactokinase [Microbacterium mangrovi]|uniref:Galactokinase n=1 Tax=Microbacterium mangrovi TaxID=1348253 RepID=A0A0B2A304_9MICO|nr:galactokinase [Microbacterium mangrovi]KHK97849.1 galactokinase [Microbacterium mangrovi]